MPRKISLMAVAILVLLPTKFSFSAWSTNSNVNTPVCSATENQLYPQIISDGSGGTIIAWYDSRKGTDFDIYAQRLDSHGNPLWTSDGVAVCTAHFDQFYPRLTSDGSGGAIITWYDMRKGDEFDIYAQRVDSSGNPLWTSDGVPVCTVFGNQWVPRLISYGSGGAIITWEDNRTGPENYDIYAQKLDSSGNPLWTADGVPVCTAVFNQWFPEITSDGSGGAIITWRDFRNETDWNIYAQRVDSSGNPLWAANGAPVCTATASQAFMRLRADGSGGAIFTWYDGRNGVDPESDIYAQRLDSAGNPLWTVDGVPVCVMPGSQWDPKLIVVDSGGAIIVWQDFRNGTDWDIFAQRVDSSGNPLWTPNGVPICTVTQDQVYPRLISDGSGGAVINWYDFRSRADRTDSDIYAQRIDSSGNPLWTLNGLPVGTAANLQEFPFLATDDSGGTIITWTDNRSGTYDVYVQRVNSDGTLGASPPPSPTGRATLIIPWYNDSGSSNLLATFISVCNPTSYNITLTVTYNDGSGVDATPEANTFILGPNSSIIGRPFQVSGEGEGQEKGFPYCLPNALAPFGSATFTAQMPWGLKIYGDIMRAGAIDLDSDGIHELFSGIAPAVSRY